VIEMNRFEGKLELFGRRVDQIFENGSRLSVVLKEALWDLEVGRRKGRDFRVSEA